MKKLLLLLVLPVLAASCTKEVVDRRVRPADSDQYVFYGAPFDRVPSLGDMRIYEAAPRVFAKSNSLQAVRIRLDEIRSLNVNVLWIMPIFRMSSRDTGGHSPYGSPYCMRDFYSVDEEFGTVADLQGLVEEAHERGMAVILDIVANHTGWDHEWITKHPDWYELRDGAMHSPDRGSSVYTNSVQLDWTKKGLQEEFIRVMKYWIAVANVDGYRCDCADWIPASFWQQAIRELREFQPGREIIMLAEGTEPINLDAGFDMNYGWTFCDRLEQLFNSQCTVAQLFEADAAEWREVPEGRSKMRFSTNHDRTSSASPVVKYGSQEGAAAAFAVATMLGGVPMIFSSQEIGYPNRISIFKNDAVVMDWTSNPAQLELYRRLMAVAASETVRRGETVRIENPYVISFVRRLGDREVLVLANPSDAPRDFALPEAYASAAYLDLLTDAPFSFTSTTLDGHGLFVLEKR